MQKTLFAILTLGLLGTASAETRATAIPPLKHGDSALQMRVLGYKGDSHGELTVEVLNPSQAASEFSAAGLYFVPDENANNAPQRLGAVGPFRARANGKWHENEHLAVPASGAITLKLDVYCIDSHRRAPVTGDHFRLAKARMPAQLVHVIDAQTRKAAKASGGYSSVGGKSAVQSEVWKARDDKWLKLEGEGMQERGK